MTGRRPMDPVDAIWLDMDRPNNLMVVVALILLDAVPTPDRFLEVVRTRLVEPYPVFRQRPVRSPLGRPAWEDDPDFTLGRHVRRSVLPEPDEAALRAAVDARLHVAFDHDHPLWEMELLEGLGAGAAVLCRFHHCLADGIALSQVLLSLTDPSDGQGDGQGDGQDDGPGALPGASRSDDRETGGLPAGDPARRDAAGAPDGAAGGPVGRAAEATRPLTRTLAALTTPAAVGGLATAAARSTAGLVRSGLVLSELVTARSPDSPLRGTPWPRKRAVWSRPFPVGQLKTVGRLCDATLNDVLMSATAGALRRYQLDHGGPAADLVTMVPVDVRRPGAPLPPELGNRFALVYVSYPCGIAGPLARLAETKRRMDRVKATPEAALTFGLITAIGRATPGVERRVVDFFADKALGVTTNVKGPPAPRRLAGAGVTAVLGWVPGSGTQTVGVCLFTYAGSLRAGFLVDAESVPDPEALVAAFELEVAELVRLGDAA